MQKSTEVEIHLLAAQLASALTSLRQRSGATVERIGRQKLPTGKTGQYRQRLLDLARLKGSDDSQAREFQHLLTKAAQNLEGFVGIKKVPRPEVAMCCMGLDDWGNYGDLIPRRDELARRIGVSIETVIDWENDTVIPALANKLALALRVQMKGESRGYDWNHDRWTVYFDNRGWISVADFSPTVIATRDGIQKVAYNLSYLGDCVRDTLQVDKHVKRCRLVDVQFDGFQDWAIIFELPHPLSRGQSHSFEFRVTYRIAAPSKPAVFIIAREQRVESQLFHLQFHPDRLPENIWCFNNEMPGSFPSGPTSGKGLEVDTTGFVEHGLCEAIEVSRTSGISWRF